jgi:hypothetical protein
MISFIRLLPEGESYPKLAEETGLRSRREFEFFATDHAGPKKMMK